MGRKKEHELTIKEDHHSLIRVSRFKSLKNRGKESIMIEERKIFKPKKIIKMCKEINVPNANRS